MHQSLHSKRIAVAFVTRWILKIRLCDFLSTSEHKFLIKTSKLAPYSCPSSKCWKILPFCFFNKHAIIRNISKTHLHKYPKDIYLMRIAEIGISVKIIISHISWIPPPRNYRENDGVSQNKMNIFVETQKISFSEKRFRKCMFSFHLRVSENYRIFSDVICGRFLHWHVENRKLSISVITYSLKVNEQKLFAHLQTMLLFWCWHTFRRCFKQS